jgi:transcriptional regulator with XRE-family HTH domain
MDRGVSREHSAEVLGICVSTLWNWETGHTSIATRFLPKVMAFLGYDPGEESRQLGDRIRMQRERQGLSQVALADKLGISPSTVTAWERGRVKRPFPRFFRLFEGYVENA